MKNRIVPVIAVTVAAAFAAAPSFAHPRTSNATSFALHAYQDETTEKPPAKPPKPQEPDAKPDSKPANPPAHEPDKKPAEKPAKPAQNPDAHESANRPAEKPAKPPKQEKQDTKKEQQNNERMSKNAGNEQNKKSVHAEQHVHYSFRSQDKTTLRQHFDTQIRTVNRSNRPHIVVGGFIPQEQITLHSDGAGGSDFADPADSGRLRGGLLGRLHRGLLPG